MRTYYVVRSGWNTANQPSAGRPANPRNSFDSGRFAVVAIVKAASPEDAKEIAVGSGVTVYNNQMLFTETNPRAVKGLAAAIRDFEACAASR